MAPVDLSDCLAAIEVELARAGLARRQQAWQGGQLTGMRRWAILNSEMLKVVVADAIAATDGLGRLEEISSEARNARSPLSYFLAVMSADSIYALVEALRRLPTAGEAAS